MPPRSKGIHKGDFDRSFEYLSKAAELGDVDAHYNLACLYCDGLGVEKDEGKGIYLLEEAAIGGHPEARYNLGCHEWNNGNKERSMKHMIIAATQGEDDSIKCLIDSFRKGYLSKGKLARALRAHKAAADSMKSSQRREAEEYYRSVGML